MDLKQYRSKLIGNDDERAVSPVIGVILMVAITVILAAVIAAFVLDLGQGQSANAQAGVTWDAEETGSGVTVTATLNNIQRADSFSVQTQGSPGCSTSDSISSVGDTATWSGCTSGSGTLQIIGTLEGQDTVVASYEL